jgi:hypothetical protein
MLLSLVLPTNRVGPAAYARILEAVSWGGPDVEVIVRDNSENKDKKKFLKNVTGENVKLIFAPTCQFGENFKQVIAEASGEFVMTFSDDDFIDSEAIPYILDTIRAHRDDPQVAGITGDYMITGGKVSSFLRFQGLDSDTPARRWGGFLASGGCSVILWSIHRREVLQETTALIKTLPMEFSFHDLVMTAVFFTRGKYVPMERYFYNYAGMGNWNTTDAVIKGDFKYYAKHGLDPSTYRLHWLFCGFEGAKLILGNQVARDLSVQDRIDFARLWLGDMRRRLGACNWGIEFEGPRDAQARMLWRKWSTERDSVEFAEVLTDLAELMALSNPEHAQRYFNFWSAY